MNRQQIVTGSFCVREHRQNLIAHGRGLHDFVADDFHSGLVLEGFGFDFETAMQAAVGVVVVAVGVAVGEVVEDVA